MPRPRLVGVLINIGQSLQHLSRKADRIMSTLDDLKAADAANATSTATALSAILALGQQHEADLAALAAKAQGNDDAELKALIDSLQGRTVSINAAVADLHKTVAPPAADPAPVPAAAPGATGAAEPAPEAPAPGATGA